MTNRPTMIVKSGVVVSMCIVVSVFEIQCIYYSVLLCIYRGLLNCNCIMMQFWTYLRMVYFVN